MIDTSNTMALLNIIGRDLLYGLLDNPYESLVLVDKDGIVRFMSSINEDIYSIKVADAIGRPIQDVNPNTRIHQTLASGKAEIGEGMKFKDKHRIVARFPIYKDNELIGAAGKLMFLNPDQLKELYDKIATLEDHISYYKSELNQTYTSRYSFDNIIGDSALMQAAKTMAQKAAGTHSPIIIMGETGTGKELFAHAIHAASRRHKHALVRVNCASIPKDLFESELFGYKPGAFTGADTKGKIGKFELAHNGTIFLDEIGDMPLSMQIKLMRILQEKEIEPIGAAKPKRIDFRLISATNRDLESLMAKGEFRLDLYYRINLMIIQLPPLRRIKTDIPLLVNQFLKVLGSRKAAFRMSQKAMLALMNYSWPGNIRELKNVIERSVIVNTGGDIQLEDLPLSVQRSAYAPITRHVNHVPYPTLKSQLEEAEKKAIIDALNISGNIKSKACRLLGIHRTGLYQKMKKYGIS